MNALKGASKVTLPLLLTKSAVRVTLKKLIGKPIGSAADGSLEDRGVVTTALSLSSLYSPFSAVKVE